MKNDPKHCTKASEDFLQLVLYACIVAAAKVCCEQERITDCVSCAQKVVSKFVSIILPSKNAPSETKDTVYNYATDLLTLSLIWHGYHDAIKEGDGNRILLYWKFLLPIFQQEG